jgi:hypothetical protein
MAQIVLKEARWGLAVDGRPKISLPTVRPDHNRRRDFGFLGWTGPGSCGPSTCVADLREMRNKP